MLNPRGLQLFVMQHNLDYPDSNHQNHYLFIAWQWHSLQKDYTEMLFLKIIIGIILWSLVWNEVYHNCLSSIILDMAVSVKI